MTYPYNDQNNGSGWWRPYPNIDSNTTIYYPLEKVIEKEVSKLSDKKIKEVKKGLYIKFEDGDAIFVENFEKLEEILKKE